MAVIKSTKTPNCQTSIFNILHTWLLINRKLSTTRPADLDFAQCKVDTPVIARLFTRVYRQPAWELKEVFLQEARELSKIFGQVS